MNLICSLYVILACLSLGYVNSFMLRHPVKREGNEYDHRWKKEKFPSPASNPEICGNSSVICDPVKILTDEQVLEVESNTEASRLSVPCDSSRVSFIISVAMVPGMYMNRNRTTTYIPTNSSERRQAAREFGLYLRDHQYNYTSNCSEQVVIVISRDDRQMYTAVADQARKLLTSECVTDIYNEAVPSLNSSLSEGLLHVVKQYRETFEQETCMCQSGECGEERSFLWAIILFPILLIIAIIGGLLWRYFCKGDCCDACCEIFCCLCLGGQSGDRVTLVSAGSSRGGGGTI